MSSGTNTSTKITSCFSLGLKSRTQVTIRITFSVLLLPMHSRISSQSHHPLLTFADIKPRLNGNDKNLLICLDAARLCPIVFKSIPFHHLQAFYFWTNRLKGIKQWLTSFVHFLFPEIIITCYLTAQRFINSVRKRIFRFLAHPIGPLFSVIMCQDY